MEPEGEFSVSFMGHSEVSTPCTIEEEEVQFPPEGFPFTGSIPISVYQNFPPNYVTLAQLVSGTPSASSLCHNPVWDSGDMPATGSFILDLTAQQTLIPAVTSILVQPTFMNPLVSSVQVTHLVQPTVSSPTSIHPSIPLGSAQVVPPLGRKNLDVSMVSGTTIVSSSHDHMIGVNQPSSGVIQNPVGPIGLSNV